MQTYTQIKNYLRRISPDIKGIDKYFWRYFWWKLFCLEKVLDYSPLLDVHDVHVKKIVHVAWNVKLKCSAWHEICKEFYKKYSIVQDALVFVKQIYKGHKYVKK